MPKTERVTKINLAGTDKDGNAVSFDYVGEDKAAELEKATKEANKDYPQLQGGTVSATKIQSFTITEAENLEDAATLFPLRALEFLNYGARLAQQNVMRDNMRDSDWAGVEGDFDLLPEVQEPKERKKASPRDKAKNLLRKIAKDAGRDIDDAAIEALLAQFIPAESEQAVA